MVIGKHDIKILSDNFKTVLLAGTVANSLDHGLDNSALDCGKLYGIAIYCKVTYGVVVVW